MLLGPWSNKEMNKGSFDLTGGMIDKMRKKRRKHAKKDEKGQNTLTSFVGTVHTSIAPTQDSFILVTVYVHIQKVKMNAR